MQLPKCSLYTTVPLLCTLLSHIFRPSLALQGPEFDNPPLTNHIYSRFFHMGPNSLGPQSTSNFVTPFLQRSRAQLTQMSTRTASRGGIFGQRSGGPNRRRIPRVLSQPENFIGNSYIHAGDDGDDDIGFQLSPRGLKFETAPPLIPLEGEHDDTCEGCGGLIKHPCCFLGHSTSSL